MERSPHLAEEGLPGDVAHEHALLDAAVVGRGAGLEMDARVQDGHLPTCKTLTKDLHSPNATSGLAASACALLAELLVLALLPQGSTLSPTFVRTLQDTER